MLYRWLQSIHVHFRNGFVLEMIGPAVVERPSFSFSTRDFHLFKIILKFWSWCRFGHKHFKCCFKIASETNSFCVFILFWSSFIQKKIEIKNNYLSDDKDDLVELFERDCSVTIRINQLHDLPTAIFFYKKQKFTFF